MMLILVINVKACVVNQKSRVLTQKFYLDLPLKVQIHTAVEDGSSECKQLSNKTVKLVMCNTTAVVCV